MPMAAQIWRVDWHHDIVSSSRHDVAVAIRADVVLSGLVRLQEPHLNLAVGLWIVHESVPGSGGSEKDPDEQHQAGQQPSANVNQISRAAFVWPCRVHPHLLSIVGAGGAATFGRICASIDGCRGHRSERAHELRR